MTAARRSSAGAKGRCPAILPTPRWALEAPGRLLQDEAWQQLPGGRDRTPTRPQEAERMDEPNAKVSELLHEASETHHQVFRITDGADDDWASWYADWLVRLSELPGLLGGNVVRSELTYLLVRLDKEYSERGPEQRWEDYYARALLDYFAGG